MAAQARFITPKTTVQLILVLIVLPMLPMIISGVWDWWEAWAYVIVSFVGFIVSRGLAARRHPDLLEERSRSMEMQGVKSWDKILAPAMALGSVFILVVAGFDKRNGWSVPFSTTANVIAFALIVLGYLLGTWALVENKFFSGVVRIQNDRGHHVVTTGPYRFVRHPGYSGTLLAYLMLPVLYDSRWAFVPAVVLWVVVLMRTSLEDKTLQEELPGYREYARKTHYRLIPGIW